MEGHTRECVERCCELANKTIHQLYKVSTPCLDDHHFFLKKKHRKRLENCPTVCSQNGLELLLFGTSWRISHSLVCNKLARAVTKRTRACYRLCSFDFLEFITQITVDNIVMWVIRQTIVDWYCCKTQTLLETLKIRNQPRREFCVSSEVEHSFPYVWMCKKQTNFSLSQFN